MPTGREQLTSGVQSCPFWPAYNTIFLLQTQVASFCRQVKTVSLYEYFPINFEVNISTFELPDKIAGAGPLPSLGYYITHID